MTVSASTFDISVDNTVATITLRRPKRLNSLTFAIYKELADMFCTISDYKEIRAVVITGAGRGFCSGGDQDDIIAELLQRDTEGLLAFTRITGRLIRQMRACKKTIIAAVNGVAVGAGAVIALASDLKIATASARFGFVFPRVGLCGADMGAGYLLPRVVGLGVASELLLRGQLVDADYALRVGLVNRVEPTPEIALDTAHKWAQEIAKGPAFAHEMTKTMLEAEHTLSLDQAIEAEAQAQALCMQHTDFHEAHLAFQQKRPPRFVGAPMMDSNTEDGS